MTFVIPLKTERHYRNMAKHYKTQNQCFIGRLTAMTSPVIHMHRESTDYLIVFVNCNVRHDVISFSISNSSFL